MRAASRRLTMLYDEAMALSGLRVTQYHLLSEIERRISDPPTVGELAEILVMERSALGQTLRPLERDGLIALKRGERDARRRTIVLTSAGSEAVARTRPYWSEAHRRFECFFGEPAMIELRTTLRELAEDPGLSEVFSGDARPR
jgi:DNA-binding MarR family transcriptional regulator